MNCIRGLRDGRGHGRAGAHTRDYAFAGRLVAYSKGCGGGDLPYAIQESVNSGEFDGLKAGKLKKQ